MGPHTVYLVFKSHLDVGFTGLAGRVLRQWHEDLIPRALAVADSVARRGAQDNFVWTTSSWMIEQHLERTRGRALRRAEQALADGRLAWHALPFTLHGEICDASLYDEGLAISTRLDARFGRRTVSAKHSDVPGETIGVVPLLAARGVRFLHIGINPCVAAPEVPDIFRWTAPSGEEIVVAYSKQYYGGELSLPDGSERMILVHANDNQPPPAPEEVARIFAESRARFPGARVVASDMNAFAEKLWLARSALPAVSSEIGNTWVHGAAADPWKLARFKALSAWRREQLRSRPELANRRSFREFSQQLLLVAEHTGGLDNKTTRVGEDGSRRFVQLGSWQRREFLEERRKGYFVDWEASWWEQREYLRHACAALGSEALRRSAGRAVDQCSPCFPGRLARTRPTKTASNLQLPGWHVQLDPADGAIVGLASLPSGRMWATESHPLARLTYEVLSASTYEKWWLDYSQAAFRELDWARADFLKPGLERLDHHTDRRWSPRLHEVRVSHESRWTKLLLILQGPAEATGSYGCPRLFSLEWILPHEGTELRVTLQWRGKPASRVPEASWLSFHPCVKDENAWRFRKLGTLVDPHDVVARGGRRLHGVEACEHPEFRLELASAALVAPGRPEILTEWQAPAPRTGGLHVNLHNNLWGTNFPLWHDDDAGFEFRITLGP